MEVSGVWDVLPEDRAETEIYRSVNGEQLRLLTIRPADGGAGPLPCMIFIHGGGFSGGKPEMMLPQCRWFAKRGFVSVTAQYRRMKLDGERPAAGSVTLDTCVADCKAAVRYVRKHAERFGIDPNQVVLVGESAGGYLACAVTALRDVEEPGADLSVSCVPDRLVAYNPITQLTGRWSSRVQDAPLADEPLPADDEAGRWLARFRRTRRLSPLWNVTPSHPPLLLMHGLQDTVVAPEEGTFYAEAVRQCGVPVRLELLPDSRHAFPIFGYTASDAEIAYTLETTYDFVRDLL